MLSKDLEATLNSAFKNARKKRHEFITVEHLLLALLDNEVATNVLLSCDCDIDRLRDELTDFLDTTTPLIPESESTRETQPTLGFQRVLQRAVFHVQSSGKREVTGANALVAIFSEQESQAVYFLKHQNNLVFIFILMNDLNWSILVYLIYYIFKLFFKIIGIQFFLLKNFSDNK